MKLPISNRLLTCCEFIRPGDIVADIGCDHGYLGIYLLLHGAASAVYASDINEQPLLTAMRNARRFGLSEKIRFYLSDGPVNLPRDFTCMVCAGMGADTIISILDSSPWLCAPGYRLILQCQSKRQTLRKYLAEHGFSISREKLAKDGKFLYTVMEVTYSPSPLPSPCAYYISPQLAEENSPLLPEYAQRISRDLEKRLNGSAGSEADEIRSLLCNLQQYC